MFDLAVLVHLLARSYGWTWTDIMATPWSVVLVQADLAYRTIQADNEGQVAVLTALFGRRR